MREAGKPLTSQEIADKVDAPVKRHSGAGPSDDGHLWLDGGNAALPINPASPYTITDGRLHRGRMQLRALLEPYLNLEAV